MMRKGTWSVYSKSDPRWNGGGTAVVGGFVVPREAEEHIERRKKKLGEEPPKDIEVVYMKD